MHGQPNTGMMRERHYGILQRLVKVASRDTGDIFIEKRVQRCPEDLQLVIVQILVISLMYSYTRVPKAPEAYRYLRVIISLDYFVCTWKVDNKNKPSVQSCMPPCGA